MNVLQYVPMVEPHNFKSMTALYTRTTRQQKFSRQHKVTVNEESKPEFFTVVRSICLVWCIDQDLIPEVGLRMLKVMISSRKRTLNNRMKPFQGH